jgi:hypothetical protein
MPEAEEVESWWRRFVQSLRTVTSPLSEHRHEDQFLRIREQALSLAESPPMLLEIRTAYDKARKAGGPIVPAGAPANAQATQLPPAPLPVELAAMELEAFSLAVEVHAAQVRDGSAKAGALDSLRRIGKTVLGSVGDLFQLSAYGKGVLAVLKEVLDFCGKE